MVTCGLLQAIGVHQSKRIPAFARMTDRATSFANRLASVGPPRHSHNHASLQPHPVIPAQAGIHVDLWVTPGHRLTLIKMDPRVGKDYRRRA